MLFVKPYSVSFAREWASVEGKGRGETMAEDSVTKVTSESWFGRMGGAVKGIVFGLFLFIIAFPVLWFNEGRAVQTARSLEEGAGIVVSVSATEIDPANQGKLIHITGDAVTSDILQDEEFGVSESAVKLRRSVEMYQWSENSSSETKKNLGGSTETTTTYTYAKKWSTRAIDSSRFQKPAGHTNPGDMPYVKMERVAKNVDVGAFKLSDSLISRMSSYEPLAIRESAVPEELSDKAQVYQGVYYLGEDPAKPAIGDVKVSFEVVRPGPVSIVAKQIGSTFEAYNAKAGKPVLLLHSGTHSAENMFAAAQSANTVTTWILRFVGFFIMLIGIKMMLRLLPVIADVVPFIGSLVDAGVGIVAFLLAGVFSSVTIALAWFAYRPLLSIGLLLVAGLFVFGLKKLKSSSNKQVAAT